MRGVPECLSRRYRALDDLIKELSLNLSTRSSQADCARAPCKDPSIKLMCQFWNILKEDPEYNLSDAVQQRMCNGGNVYYPQQVTCFMAEKDKAKAEEEEKCCVPECVAAASVTSAADHDKVPLAKILCNLKDAASYDKQCSARLNELMQTEKKLQAQIQVLEKREKNGAQLLKQADCMWSCMEEAYKKKVAESLERQKELLGELKDVEKSATKWRKNKKELESQLNHIAKCQEEINEKINQKTNDMNCMDKEMADFKKRIESNKKDSENTKKSLTKRRADSDAKMQSINTQVKKLQAALAEQKNIKKEKEKEGNQYIKESREDLQKICKVLLQKKLENEDLTAERDALLLEIEILKQTADQCKDKCKLKRESVEADIKKIQKVIEEFRIRCIRCHECTDTDDVRKFCTDCPKCMEDRECIFAGDHCDPDHTMDCVCQGVKQKFLDNVFDNMYTVLERQAKTGTGKAVAEAVLDCLKRSTNGKLNEETRKILQEFILTTVKKNLNLTIVGGAVKTRCEMDHETYQQLMTCLQKIKPTARPKEDKGTDSKKESCRRWGGASECNCPKGPKACICTKKAPPPPDDPAPCPPQDKEDAGEVVKCPTKKSTPCGPDCGAHTVPSMVGADPARWRPNPCEPPTCTFKKNMRAAQCMLGSESLASSQSYKTALPHIQSMAVLQDQITCKCGDKPTRPCTCKKDSKQLKAGIDKPCNKDSCDMTWEAMKDYSHRTIGHTTKAATRDINEIPSVQAEVFSKSVKYNDIGPLFEHGNQTKNKKKDNKKKQNKITVAIDCDCSPSNVDYSSELVNTSSGSYAIALDEKVINKIHEKTIKTPIMFVTLKETKSGNYLLDFDPNAYDSNDQCTCQHVLLKRTTSGNLSLEVDKGILNTLRVGEESTQSAISVELTKRKEVIERGSYLDDKADLNKSNIQRKSKEKITDTKKQCRLTESISQEKQIIYDKPLIDELMKETSTNKNRSSTSQSVYSIPTDSSTGEIGTTLNTSIDDYKADINKIYTRRNGHIQVKVEGENGVIADANAQITKTSSDNLAIKIKDMASVGELSLNLKERPVLIKRSLSGTYTLYLGGKILTKAPNAVLRRTSSNGVIVVITKSVTKSIVSDVNLHDHQNDQTETFKVQVKGLDNLVEPPALLKSTSSGNYELIFNKEFERYHNQTIANALGSDNHCYVELCRTPSETIIINFDEYNEKYHNKQNALLVRTQSDDIKILVNSPIFKNLPNTLSSSHSSKCKALENLVKKSVTSVSKRNVNIPKLVELKASSDTNLYKKDNLRIQSTKSLLAGASATLKRTDSGHYAIVLNKDTKTTFVNDLKTFLSNSSHGRIPIWRGSETGAITIALTGKDASLKITPSGNIYVLVNENVIKDITKDVKDDRVAANKVLRHIIGNNNVKSSTGTGPMARSSHTIKKVQNPENKAVATNCKARPDDCTCDASKCVCEENQSKSKDFLVQYAMMMDEKMTFDKESIFHDCSEAYLLKDTKPHIVIKPCGCRSKFDKCKGYRCFNVTESVCLVHKDRYENVSNEILEISGLCNKTEENAGKNVPKDNSFHDSVNWDSLSFLPPQLPTFLRDYGH